jgi:hypothetical protein
MPPEKRILLDDVLGAPADDARRAATLLAAGKIMRRRRTIRFAARSAALLAVALFAALAIHQKASAPKMARVLPAKPAPIQEGVQYLTDEQLLSLFPNVPVGLIQTSDGKKRLIFPRPGDEAKYIIHL